MELVVSEFIMSVTTFHETSPSQSMSNVSPAGFQPVIDGGGRRRRHNAHVAPPHELTTGRGREDVVRLRRLRTSPSLSTCC